MRDLQEAGAEYVVVSRAEQSALMLHGGVPSFLVQWLRALLPPALGGPLALPRRPPPPIPLPASGECSITFVGHATFLLRFAGGVLVTDPVFVDRASPFTWAGPKRARSVAYR